MSGKRQKIQYALALEPVGQGETTVSGYQGTEPFVAKPTTESPAAEQLMEEVCERENLVRAWKRVRRNKGSPGVDRMTIDDAKDYLGAPLARHPGSSARGNLPAAAGQTGRNTQAGRRVQKARRALRRRQTDPASPAAGFPGAVGPDVFQAQLRLPTGTLRPSGGSPSATIHCRGLQHRS